MRRCLLLFLLLSLAITPEFVAADVRSGACPYSCRTLGIPKRYCRDWKQNGVCFVEDTRPGSRLPAPPAPAQRRPDPSARGYIESRPCPYNCASAGVPREFCRDWREHGMCYVEDVRRPPAQDYRPSYPGQGYRPQRPPRGDRMPPLPRW